MPAKFVIKKGSTGKFRFNLHASNGQVIATSESYETKRACLQGVKSVQTNAPKATIDDTTTAAPAKKSTAKKPTAKKSTAKKSTAKKSTAKKSTAKKSTAKKSAAKKAPARKTAPRRTATRR